VEAQGKSRFQLNDIRTERLDNSAQQLICLVGNRVRVARKNKKWSRREFSELSGLSQRYIAQLENGQGNISIGLLKRVAMTLAIPIEALVTDEDLSVDEVTGLIDHYRHANAETRTRALQLLDPEGNRERKSARLCLVGLRGAGKSTLGKLIAESLNIPFIELSSEIEQQFGMPVGELIAFYGHSGFRELEAQALDNVIASHDKLVLAVAGGIVSGDNAYNKVLSRFHTVWLRASPEEHMSRVVEQGDMRPMQGNPQAMVQLKQILGARDVLYARADYQLDTSGVSVSDSQAALLSLVITHGLADVSKPL